MSTTVITTGGIAAANRAGIYGPKIEITYFKIGSAIINPDSSMTDVTGLVYTGTTNQITYQVIDDSNILFRITLDDSVGDFNIGNVGLFLSSGDMFAVTALPGVTSKIKTNFPATIGNRRIFNIIIQMSGVSNVTNLTVLIQDEAALPVVQTELNLPPANVSPFPVYMVNAHTVYGRPAFALRYNGVWYYVPADTDAGYGTYISSAFFSPAVLPGNTVYWNSTTNKFELGDGTDYTKGAVGIRGLGDKLLTFGDVYIDSSAPFIPFTTYYADIHGMFTTTKNDFQIGIALSATAVFMTIGNNEVGKHYIDTQDALRVAKAGDSMSGELQISAGAGTSNLDFLLLKPTDFGLNNPSLAFNKALTSKEWSLVVFDGQNYGQLNLKANTVTIEAPLPTATDNSNLVATTAFVQSQKGTDPNSLPTNAQVDAKITAIQGTSPTQLPSNSAVDAKIAAIRGNGPGQIPTNSQVAAEVAALLAAAQGVGPTQLPNNTQVDAKITNALLDPLALHSNRFAKYITITTKLIDDDRGTVVICTSPGKVIYTPVTVPTDIDHARNGWEVTVYNRSGGTIEVSTQNSDVFSGFADTVIVLPDKSSVTINRGDMTLNAYEVYNYSNGLLMDINREADHEYAGFFMAEYS